MEGPQSHTDSPQDVGAPPLGRGSKELKAGTQTVAHTPMFTGALFTKDKRGSSQRPWMVNGYRLFGKYMNGVLFSLKRKEKFRHLLQQR